MYGLRKGGVGDLIPQQLLQLTLFLVASAWLLRADFEAFYPSHLRLTTEQLYPM